MSIREATAEDLLECARVRDANGRYAGVATQGAISCALAGWIKLSKVESNFMEPPQFVVALTEAGEAELARIRPQPEPAKSHKRGR